MTRSSTRACRTTSVARRERLVTGGPRLQLLEVLLVLGVILIFAAIVSGWLLLDRSQTVAGACLIALGALGILAVVFRTRRVRQLSRIARRGHIAMGHVAEGRPRRLTLAPRVDGLWPTALQPLVHVQEVHYSFLDDRGEEHAGRFSVAARAADSYPPGRDLEIYYDHRTGRSCPSLAMRWYFRLGGPARRTTRRDTAPAGAPQALRGEQAA